MGVPMGELVSARKVGAVGAQCQSQGSTTPKNDNVSGGAVSESVCKAKARYLPYHVVGGA